MSYKVHLEEFEGPLDLLLKLIEAQDLDIAKVSLADVADDYLGFVETESDIAPEALVDFLVVATKLLLIKSRLLLPVAEEEEEELDLENQLKIYKAFLDASKKIETRLKERKFLYWPKLPPQKIEPSFSPPEGVSGEYLKQLFEGVIKKIEPVVDLPQSVMEKTVTLKEKLSHIRGLLGARDRFNFDEVVKNAKSKTEVIVVFLALLELVKNEEAFVCQNRHFENITIEKNGCQNEKELEEGSLI